MPTRNVVLSDRQQQMVETLVRSGRYQNASEVLREGLRLIEERERLEDAKLKALKQAARQGWADVSAGRYVDVADDQLEDFIGQLGRSAAQRAKITGEAAIALSQHGTVAPVTLYQRTDFAASMIDGRTVQEIDAGSRSAGEIEELWNYVSAQLSKK